MARVWTEEQRARQAAKINDWKPWLKSTGPTSAEGRAASTNNVLTWIENRAKELDQARQALADAEAKIEELTRGKESPQADRMLGGLLNRHR